MEPSRTRTCDPRVKSQHLPFSSVLYNTNMSPASHRRSRISKPAPIASTASTVLTVVETRTFSNGKSPVRINQTASKIIPRFLPATVLVIAKLLPPLTGGCQCYGSINLECSSRIISPKTTFAPEEPQAINRLLLRSRNIHLLDRE